MILLVNGIICSKDKMLAYKLHPKVNPCKTQIINIWKDQNKAILIKESIDYS